MKFRREKKEDAKIKNFRYLIFKLDKKQRKETDKIKKTELALELKEKIESILELVPDDIDMQTKLMYTYINLKEMQKAKELGYNLLRRTQSRDVLNGLSIIEEMGKNYDIAIQMNKRILEIEPDNEFYKKRIHRLQDKKQETNTLNPKDRLYREIATLERNLLKIIEKRTNQTVISGEKLNTFQIQRKAYLDTYSQIKKIAKDIIQEYPEEIVARERLLKALFYLGEEEQARETANEIFNLSDKDEIALWYMSRIERNTGNLYEEEKYLKKILESSDEKAQIKVQQRLAVVRKLIDQKEEKEQLENEKEQSYTEDVRKEWIEDIQKQFIDGSIRKEDIKSKMEEAKRYPNFSKSYIELTNLYAHITGDLEQQIQALEEYINTTQTLTKNEYHSFLNEIYRVRGNIEKEKEIEKFLTKKENKDNYEKSNEQRQFSKKIIDRLKEGKITKKELPAIEARLQTFPDAAKSIFLITKLYEIVEGRDAAYQNLTKYTTILNLSDTEKRQIKEMQQKLMDKPLQSGATNKIEKEIVERKENQEDSRLGDEK